jgi:hypothetical protein
MRTPSIKSIRRIPGVTPEQAREAKRILQMTRAELECLPAGAARVAECYHPPKTYDLRLECLNAALGMHGVEGFQTSRGNWAVYLNAGDTYALTIVFYRGTYRVACWGDIAERDCA